MIDKDEVAITRLFCRELDLDMSVYRRKIRNRLHNGIGEAILRIGEKRIEELS